MTLSHFVSCLAAGVSAWSGYVKFNPFYLQLLFLSILEPIVNQQCETDISEVHNIESEKWFDIF